MSNKKCLCLLFANLYKSHKIRVSNRESRKYQIHFLFYYNYSYLNDFWVTVEDANVLLKMNQGSQIHTSREAEFAFLLRNNILLLVR